MIAFPDNNMIEPGSSCGWLPLLYIWGGGQQGKAAPVGRVYSFRRSLRAAGNPRSCDFQWQVWEKSLGYDTIPLI